MAELDIDEIRKDWERATEGLASWRSEARESYDFASSHQWTEDDIARLEAEERPAVTFDRIGVFVDAVCGMEINNRQEIKYLPVEMGDVHLNETLTQAAKYYENDCGAEDEDSEAVRDAVTCGVGVTEMLMEHEKHPDGAPATYRRDPLLCWFDPNAVRRNLKDARFLFYGVWMDRDEAEERWPDAVFSGEPPPGSVNKAGLADRAFLYEGDDGPEDEHEGQVFILHYQCWKKQDIYRLRDPDSGKLVDFPKSKFSAAKKFFVERLGQDPIEGQDFVKSRKKVYYRAFVSGDEILEQDMLPSDAFTFNFITFKRDRNNRMWYGIVRTMKDPQRWANKWLSQILAIVNANAKGGAFVETGALADPRKAEEDWATAAPLIQLKEGGIGKIKERTPAAYPSGLDRLTQLAFNALPLVSGLNLEALGLADREQAGILETQRKQSAYQILAPLFAAVREYRKSRGKLLLKFLKFIPQGTLVRIIGPEGEQWVPFVYQDTQYDVKVDQAPDSPDYKQKVWDAMGQIIPAMMKAGYPIPPELLLYSPLPATVSEKWVGWIKQQGWMPPEVQKQVQEMQQNLQQLGQENQQLKQQNMMLQLDHSVEMNKLQGRMQESGAKNAVKVYQAELAAMSDQHTAMIKAVSDRLGSAVDLRRAEIEALSKSVKQMQDAHLKQIGARQGRTKAAGASQQGR